MPALKQSPRGRGLFLNIMYAAAGVWAAVHFTMLAVGLDDRRRAVLAFLIVIIGGAAAIGGYFLWRSMRALMTLSAPRVRLSLDDDELRPGAKATLRWQFDKPTNGLRGLTIVLEGYEVTIVTYKGTPRERLQAFATMPVFRMRAPVPRSGQADIAIPLDARVSSSKPNEVRWALRARPDLPGWPDTNDEYPVVIRAGP